MCTAILKERFKSTSTIGSRCVEFSEPCCVLDELSDLTSLAT